MIRKKVAYFHFWKENKMKDEVVNINDDVNFCNGLPFVFIGGPCQIESEEHALMVCEFLVKLTSKLNIPYVFKSSFDKANRTSVSSKRGLGLDKSISVFEKIKKEFNCPILTDVHLPEQCDIVKDYVDILQLPAFLCRQTDLIEALAKTQKPINIKKGQFLSPYKVKNIVEKFKYFGNRNVLLTERGTTFGYNDLVVDMRNMDIMAQTGKPVIIDATHSIQHFNENSNITNGNREMAQIIARSAVASRPIAGVFCEVHNDPDNAFSDGDTSLNFEMIEKLLIELKQIDDLVKNF